MGGLQVSGGGQRTTAAKFYAITKAGGKALGEETAGWRQTMGLVERLLKVEFQDEEHTADDAAGAGDV